MISKVNDLNPLLAKEPLWTKDYVLLTISNFFMFVSLQMLLPTLPVYVEEMGARSFEVGLAVSLFAAAALLARPFSGIILDNVGRKVVLLTGLGTLVLFSIQYFWITSIFVILLLRVLHGLSWGISTTGMSTVAADIVPASRRGEGLGYFGLSVTVSLAIAPFLGLWIAEQFGFTWMFIISFVFATASLLMTTTVNIPDQSVKKSVHFIDRKNFWANILEKRALIPALLVFLFTSAYSGVEIYIAMFAAEKNIPSAGPFFIVLAIAMFIVRPISGKLYDRFGVRDIVLTGVIITISGILLLSFSHTMVLMLISGAICGAGLSAVMPSMQAWNVDRAPANRLGAANGTYLSGIDLGFAFGSMVNAIVADITSYATMYQLVTLYLVLFFVIFVTYHRRTHKNVDVHTQA